VGWEERWWKERRHRGDGDDTLGLPPLLPPFLLLFFLGMRAWGGPMAHIAMIKDHLVTEQKWISGEKFVRLHGIYQMLPGELLTTTTTTTPITATITTETTPPPTTPLIIVTTTTTTTTTDYYCRSRSHGILLLFRLCRQRENGSYTRRDGVPPTRIHPDAVILMDILTVRHQ